MILTKFMNKCVNKMIEIITIQKYKLSKSRLMCDSYDFH